jgi:hypothetical protein
MQFLHVVSDACDMVSQCVSASSEDDVARDELFSILTQRADEAQRQKRVLKKKLAGVRLEREYTESTLGQVEENKSQRKSSRTERDASRNFGMGSHFGANFHRKWHRNAWRMPAKFGFHILPKEYTRG